MDLYKGMDQLRDLSKLYMDMKTPQVQEETVAPEQVDEMAKEPYAIGMAAAMKSTGDKPPLEKSTITKAHKIAKKIIAKEEAEKEEVEKDEKDECGKDKESKHAKGKEEKGEKKTEKEMKEGIDFKGAAREQARRDAEQAKKDKEVPTNKERRLALGRFRPGASSAERAEGGRDALKQKKKVPTKSGKPMFDNFEIMADYLIGEGQVQSVQEASEFLAGAPQEFLQDVLRFAEQRMLFMSYLVETGHCADLTEAASVYVESDPELVKDVIDSIIAD